MQKKKKVSVESNIKEKVEYIGLNFDRVPKTLIATDNLNFRTIKGYDEKQYKQYKFIKISDIDILLTPKHRMDELKERYDEASPLYMYLDSTQEENTGKYATFLNMLKKVEVSEIEKIAVEQELLAEEIPYKVKFNWNYLWQIYYSEEQDRYFMLVPTEDSDYSTFFYLLKKKIENKKNEMIFAPISYLEYSGNILKKSEIKDLENYLWLFTQDYPSIYEVTDKKGKQSLQIIGETKVYGNIKTLYKMKFNNSKEASKFFKLTKALFILQTELPKYYKFETKINKEGELELYLEGEQLQYEKLLEFVSSQYKKAIQLREETNDELDGLTEKLEILKQESIKLEKEYIEKEKNISMYLECKKSFFGKVKYFFTMGKKSKKVDEKNKKDKSKINKEDKKEANIEEKIKIENKNYTLDELIVNFKNLEIAENNKKNLVQDINAIKLKNKNLKKKIENASAYINEINKHKRSIFEFWKYANKDEVAKLEEGEEETVNVTKIEKTFNFENDFDTFGESIDKSQRIKFTDQELDSSYIASTDLLEAIRIVSRKGYDIKELTEYLRILKEQMNDISIEENEEFDIFGSNSKEIGKERNLGNKTHREVPRNKYEILGIKKGMKVLEFKKALVEAYKDITRALKKNTLDEEIYVYKASGENMDIKELQIFSLNEEDELNKCFNQDADKDKIYLYRIKLSRGTNFVAISNIILYNNKNMTLPVGMQESSNILIDASTINLKEIDRKLINIKQLEDEKNDFSELVTKTIEVIELEG